MSDLDALLARLVEWARDDENLRALIQTSSRASGRHVDEFSDIDPILYLRDPLAVARDEAWTARFGPVLVQWGEDLPHGDPPRYFRGVVYQDGSKADFTLTNVTTFQPGGPLPEALDVGYIVLVDKDGLTDGLPPATFRAHVPNRPDQAEYASLVNDFWWESTYVAKSLRRDQLLFAKHCLDEVMKLDYLRRMLEWLVESDHDWSLNPGKLGRWLKPNLPPDLWREVEASFAGGSIEENWQALWRTTTVFRRASLLVAERLGLTYPHDLDARVSAYLRGVYERGAPQFALSRP